ncbi:PASTA domain-containing protein [Tessaracoccus sp. HDW20]|uniref:PASTA domain-containing protein n=1 Tax=Tessaracoccus coleopterorum TaxID=2714950 RepID=UPI0018D42EF8|nr:PASTA domain-containing protein [Tessaracoccus coleopterorum]
MGLTREEAEKALTDGRLAVGKVTEAWSEDKAAGTVLKASVEEGAELKRDTPVDLTVSKGREPIRVPDLVGSSAANAEKELDDLGFRVSVKEENSATVEKGNVIRQDPRSGNLYRGDTVTIVRSLGPQMVTIPGVWGKNADDAKKILEDLDLKVEIQNDSGFGLPLNLAKSTDPAEGSKVPVGSTVKLIIV